MINKIFLNLPVKDLERSKEFFTKLGFKFNPQFTSSHGACLVINETTYAMFTTHEFVNQLFEKNSVKKQIADAHKVMEVLVALSLNSRKEVDDMFKAAVNAGGHEVRPTEDIGFMYTRAFEDPDGHIWEPFWMDPKHVQ